MKCLRDVCLIDATSEIAEFDNVKNHYFIDENVTCVANGSPEPTYVWKDANDTTRSFSTDVLTFDSDWVRSEPYLMVCEAYNLHNGGEIVSRFLGPFTVGTFYMLYQLFTF